MDNTTATTVSDGMIDRTTKSLGNNEDILLLLASSRATTNNLQPDTTPKLQVSPSGHFEDQFYHAHNASRTIGIFKNRAYTKQMDKHQDGIAKHLNVNSRDIEQFSDTDIVYAGYLMKQGSYWKTWRKRYFILRRDIPVLAYYSSHQDLVKLGEITIDAKTSIQIAPLPATPNRFIVQHENRQLVLVGDDTTVDPWRMWITKCIAWRTVEQEVNQKPQASPHQKSPLKRFSTDSVSIQEAVNETSENEDLKRQSFVRQARLRTIDTDSNTWTILQNSTPSTKSVRHFRSYSADSVLSSHFKCNPLSHDEPPHSAVPHHEDAMATRARNLSLPTLRPAPSIELAISVGCRGTQDVQNMLVVLSRILAGQETKEVARTEVQTTMALRIVGSDLYLRDFSVLLSVPLHIREVLQFEVFAVLNMASETLSSQQSLGFVRMSALDLLVTRDTTIVLECRRDKMSPSNQTHFIVVDRILPSESLQLGHLYTYARRHFITDIVTVCPPPKVSWNAPSPGATVAMASAALAMAFIAPQPPRDDALLQSKEKVEPTHVIVSEELSVSLSSISITLAFMKFLQSRNQQYCVDTKQFIHDMETKYDGLLSSLGSEDSDVLHSHVQMLHDAHIRMAHYNKLVESYQECTEYLIALEVMLQEGKEPGITSCLKRSTLKKDKRTEFMPTNLNYHLIRGRRVALNNTKTQVDDLVHGVVTHGCTSAHCMGFKEGGLRRMQHALSIQTQPDPRLVERIEQRQDIVRCQVLAIASTALLSVMGHAANQSTCHQVQVQLMSQAGFLLSVESLLSTIQNEKGMLEDMVEGIKWLHDAVSIKVHAASSSNVKYAQCVNVSRHESGDGVVASFAIPLEVFNALPPVIQHGHLIKVYAVMFTQGINEMQSVANTVLDTSLQDEINWENIKRLHTHFQMLRTHWLAIDPSQTQRLERLGVEIDILVEKLSRRSIVQRKNVNILIDTSDVCRQLGAGRTTCCKSGKDRTGMSVTLECSRLLVDTFRVKQGVHLCNAMRERGVRRVNVLANTGKNKFAFNSLQLKCLPDCYRPPVVCADSKTES